MYHFRWTVKELELVSNWKLIDTLISERKSSCGSPYSPLYKRLVALENWAKKEKIKSGIPDWKILFNERK